MPLIVLLILTPAIGAAVMLLLDPRGTPARSRTSALMVAIITFALSIMVAGQYGALTQADQDQARPIKPRLEVRHTWMEITSAPSASVRAPALKCEFQLGVDGVSLLLILLTTALTMSSILISWNSIENRSAEFYALLLILESGLIGVFCAFDILLFYVFFEFTLIPLFLLVGIWGGPLRKYASHKFFVYTLAGSLVSLLGIVALVIATRNSTQLETPFSLPAIAATLTANPLPPEVQMLIFLALSAGFLIKVPLFPFHTWLPLAHVEAPTAGSVLLAGVLLKLGTYGFFRLCLPILPDACLNTGRPMIALLAVIGILYGSFCALAQNDIKKLVAYSSVAHLGFCMLGLFALNVEGMTGSILQMVNHGLSTGALFCLVGMFYERYHTRLLTDLGGLASKLPRLGVAMVLISFASIGLPGLNGFVGEVLCLMGMYAVDPLYAALGALGVVLGAWYLLGVLQKAFFGPVLEPHHGDHSGEHSAEIRDLDAREVIIIVPLAILCIYLGLFPQRTIELIRPDVEAVARLYQKQAASTKVVANNLRDEPVSAIFDHHSNLKPTETNR